MARYATDSQHVIPKGIASPMDYRKAAVKCIYPEEAFPVSHINAKWNTPDKAAGMLHMQTLWDWLCAVGAVHPPSSW